MKCNLRAFGKLRFHLSNIGRTNLDDKSPNQRVILASGEGSVPRLTMPPLNEILRGPCPEPLRLRSGQACRMDQDDKYREFLLITVMPDVVNRASIFNLLWMDPR